MGTFTMSRAAFPALQQAGDAAIINISATLHYGATWYQVHASAAKAAVDSITRSLALEWGEYGIRVNGVAPGPIKGTAGGGGQQTGESRGAKDTCWHVGQHTPGTSQMHMPPSTRQHVKSRASAKPVVGHQHVPGRLAVRVPAAPPPTHPPRGWPASCAHRHVQAGSW